MGRAIRDNSPELLLAWISIWRWHAGELRGYLDIDIPVEKKVMKSIQRSIVLCGAVKVDINSQAAKWSGSTITSLQESVATVTAELGNLSVSQLLSIEGSSNG